MRHVLLIISFFLILKAICFSQESVKNNKSTFLNGVQLENPNYNFQWNFQINDIPSEKFLNYKIDKKVMSVWTHIKFDSVIFLNEFLFRRVVVKAVKRKNDDKYKMIEFVGIVDFKTLNKMTAFFNYKWKGWIIYPREKPLYKFRFYKTKKEGAIVVESH